MVQARSKAGIPAQPAEKEKDHRCGHHIAVHPLGIATRQGDEDHSQAEQGDLGVAPIGEDTGNQIRAGWRQFQACSRRQSDDFYQTARERRPSSRIWKDPRSRQMPSKVIILNQLEHLTPGRELPHQIGQQRGEHQQGEGKRL